MDYVKLNGGGSLEADRNTLFELLLKKTRELGRALSFEDAKGDPDLPNPNAYAQHFPEFHQFSDAAAAAFSKIEFEKEYPGGSSSELDDSSQIGAYSSAAAQRNGFEKVSSRKKAPAKKRERATWTDERILDVVEALYDRLDRMPSLREYDEFHKEMPEITPAGFTISRRFYTWANVERLIEERKLKRVRKEMNESGKEMNEMAKKKATPERDNEGVRTGYIELVLDEWKEKGRMPSPRSLKKNSLFKYDRLLAVFGSYQELERVVTEEARKQGLVPEKAKKEIPIEPVGLESEVEKMEEKKRKRKVWTEESVIEAVKRFYDEQGRLPTGSDFKVGGCDYLPAEMTVRKHLGKKTEWLAAISHDEMDTMLRALSEAGLDDEPDDPFEASGEALNFGGSKALQTTPARAAIVLNKAVHEMLDKVSSELDIASASVELIVEASGVSNPVVMRLEF